MKFAELYNSMLVRQVVDGFFTDDIGNIIAPYEWGEEPEWYWDLLRQITSKERPVWFNVPDGTTFCEMRPPFRVMYVGVCGDSTTILVDGMYSERIEKKWTYRFGKHLVGVRIKWVGGENEYRS